MRNKLKQRQTIDTKTKRIFIFSSIFYFLFFIFYFLTPPAYAADASFSFTPSSGSYKVGSSFNVNVVLNTGNNAAAGADAIFSYEPGKLEAQSITVGSIFSSYPVKTINSTVGKISISGIASDPNTSFSGEDVFATITFKSIASGTTTLRFDFTLDEPTDSNVAKKGSQGEDILVSVANATYSLVTSTPGTGGDSPTVTPPVSGVFEITLAVLLASLALFVSGFFLFLKKFALRS